MAEREFDIWFRDCCYELELEYPSAGFYYLDVDTSIFKDRHWKQLWHLFDPDSYSESKSAPDSFGEVILQAYYESKGFSAKEASKKATERMDDLFIQAITEHAIAQDKS